MHNKISDVQSFVQIFKAKYCIFSSAEERCEE